MTEPEPENLILRYVRRIDERLERVEAGQRDLRDRVGSLEQRVSSGMSHLETQYAALSNRFVRMEDRLDRIQRRLGLVEA